MAGETLRDLVLWCRTEMERESGRPVSLQQLARRSFGRVDEGLLHALLAGVPGSALTDRQLEGLTLALNLSPWRVHRAASNS